MDLAAYMQIDRLEAIAKANDIDIPRLRGYRLMSEVRPVSSDEFAQLFLSCELEVIEELCIADPFWSSVFKCSNQNYRTEKAKKRYIKHSFDEDGNRVSIAIRWDRIHGWKRRVLKQEIKKLKKKAIAQYSLWNQYAGKENVLYIHARIGGKNWDNLPDRSRLLKAPWFLDRIDDCWDNTYCDFYAKLDPTLLPEESTMPTEKGG